MSRIMEERMDGMTADYIKNLMNNLQLSAEKAMDALGLLEDERERVLPLLNAQP